MSEENEKPQIAMEEHKAGSDTSPGNPLPEIGSPERIRMEKKLVRKLDSRLLPTIFLIYIMNYIDVRVHLCVSQDF